jgi:hypothetical protein
VKPTRHYYPHLFIFYFTVVALSQPHLLQLAPLNPFSGYYTRAYTVSVENCFRLRVLSRRRTTSFRTLSSDRRAFLHLIRPGRRRTCYCIVRAPCSILSPPTYIHPLPCSHTALSPPSIPHGGRPSSPCWRACAVLRPFTKQARRRSQNPVTSLGMFLLTR